MAAAGLAVGWSGDAAAQQARPLTISAGIEVRHDSNAARASAARAALRGLARDDFAVSPTIEVDVLKLFGRNQLAVSGALAYDFYNRNSFLNRERIALSANGLVHVSDCTVTLSPSFSRRQSDLGEIAIPQAGGEAAVRNVETVQAYGGSVECGDDIGLRPFAGVDLSIADNSSAFRRFSDNRRVRYSGGLGYARPTLGKIQLIGGIDDVDYPNRPRIGGEQDGFRTHSAGIRFQRDIGLNLQGSVQVNHMWLRPRRADAPRFTGLTYDVGLTATFADRLRLGVNLNRSAQPALQTDAAYRVERAWDITASYAASSILNFNAGATFAKRDYRGERTTFGPLLNDDRRNTYVAGVTYLFSPRLKFGADVRYQRRDADDPFYNYSNLSEMISVKFVY